MAVVKPFKGIRPNKDLAHKVASLPYDVMNREEAKEMAKGNEYSFLHVVRSEIDVEDSISQYDEIVYKTARKNLDNMIRDKVLVQDDTPKFYIYRQIMDGRVQTGIVGCTSIDDYINDIIKKHEFTRPEKEVDRINNFDYCDANTAPIFLTYRKNDELNRIINDWIKFHKPIYNFTSEDSITHIAWIIDEDNINTKISEIFDKIDYLYIADGHHRSASSVKVGLKRREANPDYTGQEEFNYFLSVIFPDEDLFIMDYNRVVKDLNGLTYEEFMNKVREKFDIEEYNGEGQYKPVEKHTFGMYINDKWYKLTAKQGIYDANDPVDRLDVSILQKNLLHPILGIENPRTDKRIDFVGGIRGLEELERRVAKDMKVAFSMYPTTMEDLLSIADAGEVMPPKSTWFEPKLRSGLFVHRLSD
ncbi:DUF1015 domain-containing protein [Paramaledivibacter caminithermalis]|uniref:Uncharacterized conserved protein, DUF1015 family n=1 Tax=Paramaledivibacter caminithermalis (strain DSM 15212 / CIP 107654 / DViRD3) TaxID=1121301 RepID=A0A1M6SSW0_PARC5|nr:DUF1015 family protein [Paramaledivibacter caminithermalis]SHK47769.1 Uncharacterized conserved protein, DUF1015 family [Paramaledivibacter caminithermalis DSM 15212]